MFKRFIKAASLVLALCLAVGTLCACTSEKKAESPVITITREDGTVYDVMDEGMFAYFAAEQKTMYLYTLLGDGNFQQYALQYDTPEFWNHVDTEGEVSLGEYVYDEAIVLEAKNLLTAAYIFDEVLELEFPEQLYESIDEQMANLEKAMGTREAFDEYLLGYGTTVEAVRRLEELHYKRNLLEMALFNEEAGGTPVSDEDVKLYFKDNYAIVKHVLVNTSFVIKDDGTSRDLTEDELAQKQAMVENVQARIAAGEDFDALVSEFAASDAAGNETYPHGYFVTDDETFLPEFRDAALDMEVGEVRTVQSSYGTHIMKKYPMNAELYNAYDDVYAKIKETIQATLINAGFEAYSSLVTVDEEIIDSYNITTIQMLLG